MSPRSGHVYSLYSVHSSNPRDCNPGCNERLQGLEDGRLMSYDRFLRIHTMQMIDINSEIALIRFPVPGEVREQARCFQFFVSQHVNLSTKM